jgi:hypothetical protein
VAETFAHNVELSLLQQAGILGVPYLFVLAFCSFRAIGPKGRPEFRSAIIASLLVAQVEPLFEGTVGGFFAWLPIFAGYFVSCDSSVGMPWSWTARVLALAGALQRRNSRKPRTAMPSIGRVE